MISRELALDFAKELYGSAVKLTPCVYKYEGIVGSSSYVNLFNNRDGRFILVKISSTNVTNLSVVLRSRKMQDYVFPATPMTELNDCDDLFLPVTYVRVNNDISSPQYIGVFAYGYAVE